MTFLPLLQPKSDSSIMLSRNQLRLDLLFCITFFHHILKC
ncbi:unnamed protein product [Tenebrio molitor]|nr:unnamed protein product [Tenebrio molitor]